MKTNENRDKSLEKMNIKEEDVIRETLVTKAKESIRDVLEDMLDDSDLEYMEELAKYKDGNLIEEIKKNKELSENISDKLKENGSNVNIEDLGKELKEELNNVTVKSLLEENQGDETFEVWTYDEIANKEIEDKYNKEISDKLKESFKNCISIEIVEDISILAILYRYPNKEITKDMLNKVYSDNINLITKSEAGMYMTITSIELEESLFIEFDEKGDEILDYDDILEIYEEIDINEIALKKCKEYTKERIKYLVNWKEYKNYTKEDIKYLFKYSFIEDLKDEIYEGIEEEMVFIPSTIADAYILINNELDVEKIKNFVNEILFENKTFVQIEKGDKESNNNLYNYLYNETEMRKDEIVEKFRNNDIYADKDGKMIVNIKGEDGEITGAYQMDITKGDKEIILLDNSKEKSEEVENFINNKVLEIEENQEQTEEIEEDFEIE